MSSKSLNDNKIKENIFEKYYLQQQQNIKENQQLSMNISQATTKSNLTSSQIITNTNDINIESTNNFTKCFHNAVVPYLSIKDLINLKKCSKLLNIIISQKAIDICILSNSINKFSSNEYRLSVWSYYVGLNEFTKSLINQYFNKNEENNEKINLNEKEKEYYKYISDIIDKINKNEELSEQDKILYNEDKIKNIKNSIDFIKRDIDRTFYNDFFTKEDGKVQLKNTLERMCAVPGNVGYCQGMNFIVGAMLYLFKNETKTLYVFSNLIQKYELTTLFAYNTPDYGVRVYQINYYVKKYIPSVYYHFKNNNLSFDMIYSRWLLTLFANYLDINRLDFPWSCLFIHKWKGIIKICLLLIYELKEQLLKCDLEKLSNLLKEDTFNFHNNYQRSFFLYQKHFKVKNKKLKELRNEYFIDLAKKKLEDTNSQVDQWEEDQKQPLNEYLEKKKKLETESEQKIKYFKQINEDANKKYLIAFKQYSTYMKGVRTFQEGIDKIATEKFEYDRIISHYTNIINDIDNPQNTNQNINNNNNGGDNKTEDEKKIDKKEKKKMEKAEKAMIKKKNKEMKNKKIMLTKEKNKIMEKYAPIKREFDAKTELLYKKCDIIDKYKTELDKWDDFKKKTKNEMQKYLFEIEEKNKEFIQVLSDKLKLSENYKKTYKF
jgi:hypothetical protein